MKIRKATKKDFEKYFPLKVEESKEYSKIIGKKIKIPSKARLKKEFLGFVSKKNSYVYFVEEKKEILAYMNFSIYKNIWSQCGYIEDIFVLKEHRGKGLARGLIGELIKILRNKKIKQVILSVNVKNSPAIKLYKKLGFEITKYDMRKKL